MRLGISRISGVRAGEVEIDLISHASAIVRVKYAFVRDDGATVGFFAKSGGWSEATQEALQRFTEALEADAFADAFVGQPGPPEEEEGAHPSEEPKQF